MSSMTHVNLPRITPSDDGKPERSRNAKAQARHREKRKLYIEQVSELISPVCFFPVVAIAYFAVAARVYCD